MGAIIPQRAARSTLNVPAGGERAERNARQRNSTGESSERCTAADTPFSEHILRISDSPRTMNAVDSASDAAAEPENAHVLNGWLCGTSAVRASTMCSPRTEVPDAPTPCLLYTSPSPRD